MRITREIECVCVWKRKYDNRKVYYMEKSTRMAMRLKIGVKLNWF